MSMTQQLEHAQTDAICTEPFEEVTPLSPAVPSSPAKLLPGDPILPPASTIPLDTNLVDSRSTINRNCSPVCSPSSGQASCAAGRQNGDLLSRKGAVKLSNVRSERPAAASVSRWRVDVDYEARFMEDLGKNRYLATLLTVPPEANTRFTQIKQTLEADVWRIISSVRSSNQISWTCRLCMIGLKSGTMVTAEPTVLISCTSSKHKTKIKGSFRRIRPHYLDSLGMTLIVRHDPSAPILAGHADERIRDDGDEITDFGAIRIERGSYASSCGLKILVESYTNHSTYQSYATLGGVIKMGGTFYGLTTAHAIVGELPNRCEGPKYYETEESSDIEPFEDSSNDEDEHSHALSDQDLLAKRPKQSLQFSNRGKHNIEQDMAFTRLADVRPGAFMSYSFNGECRSGATSIVSSAFVSDWAILEISEAYILPNSYLDSSSSSKNGDVRRIFINSFADAIEMESGIVRVLCNTDKPLIGYLNMNHVSLQFIKGSLDVHEVRLESPLSKGMSGSWVVRNNQALGMVVALSNEGLSCYIVPMWRTIQSIMSVCKQKVQIHDIVPASQDRSNRVDDDREIISTTKYKINAPDPTRRERISNEQYEDLLSRMIHSQELIAKTLSAIQSPPPLLDRYLEMDDRSDTSSTRVRDHYFTDRENRFAKPSDSISQGSTLAVLEDDYGSTKDLDTHANLRSQNVTAMDLSTHVKSPLWKSKVPVILQDLLTQHLHQIASTMSLSSALDAHLFGTTSKCYYMTKRQSMARVHGADKATGSESWSILTHPGNVNDRDHEVFGKTIIIREPTALHLATLHLALADDFDMSAILRMLVDETPTKSHMKGYLKKEPYQQKSLVFSFKYHCMIENQHVPLPWQEHDGDAVLSAHGLLLCSCSAVIGLSLAEFSPYPGSQKRDGEQTIPNKVSNPFGPWKVLRIQCFPDSISASNDHGADSRFINGPGAFLTALLREYKDALARFRDLHQKISDLVLPPTTLVFDSTLRDELLFENSDYSLSRKYFWAQQVLKLMNKEIEDLLTAYAQAFTSDVWSGEHKYIWAGILQLSPDYHTWRQTMTTSRKEFENELAQLQLLRHSNVRLQRDIDALRGQLFTGLAVDESRKAVKDAQTIKLLTLVTLGFLPASFIAAFFSMDVMRYEPSEPKAWRVNTSIAAVFTSATMIFLVGLLFPSASLYPVKVVRWTIAKIQERVRSSLQGSPITSSKPSSFASRVVPKSTFAKPTDATMVPAKGSISAIRERQKAIQENSLPPGIRHLWVDRRNGMMWYTFWVVLGIALLSSFLNLLQLYLQFSQKRRP